MRNAFLPFLLTAILCPAPLFAQPAEALAQPSANVGQEVTVTGRRLRDFRDRLAACLARSCPPDEDIAATLALAEVEFESNSYEAARRTIADSVGRNRDEARRYPEPLASLFRARARVARHMGRDDEALRSSYDVVRSIQRGIPTEDHRHFTARLELAEALTLAGRLDSARRELNALARLASSAGREDVAALAELRGTWISYLLEPNGDARTRLVEMSNDPRNRMRSVGAQTLLARLYRQQGDTRRADALITQLAQRETGRRTVVYAPPYNLLSRDMQDRDGASSVNDRITDVYGEQWIDVGFWVMPDGKVEGLEIVRRRGPVEWADPLLNSIRGRRYTISADQVPTFRLERYTYTAEHERVTGTRIARRSTQARVEYYDLSTGELPPDLVIPERPPVPVGRPTVG